MPSCPTCGTQQQSATDYATLNAEGYGNISILDIAPNPFWDVDKREVDHEMAMYWARKYTDMWITHYQHDWDNDDCECKSC